MIQRSPRPTGMAFGARWARPAAAGVLLLAAVVLGWDAGRQWYSQAQHAALVSARDTAAASAQQAVRAAQKRLVQQAAAPAVLAAANAGQWDAAGEALGQGWAGVSDAAVMPLDLTGEYGALAPGGYGRLAVVEASMEKNQPVASLVRHGQAVSLGVASPVIADGHPIGTAYVRLQLTEVARGLTAAAAGPGYLAFRQGPATAGAVGEATLADSADALAVPVAGARFRLVAAAPPEAAAVFGLWPSAGAALVLMAAALAIGFGVRVQLPRRHVPLEDNEHVLTVSEAAAKEAASAPATKTKTKTAASQPPGGRAEAWGLALGSLLAEQGLTDVVVARGFGEASQATDDAFIAGLRQTGRRVIDIGTAPAPVAHFAALHLRAGSFALLHGSADTPRLLAVVGSQPLEGSALQALADRADAGRFARSEEGALAAEDIAEAYAHRVANDAHSARAVAVAVTPGPDSGWLTRTLEAAGARVGETGAAWRLTLLDHGRALAVERADGTAVAADRVLMVLAEDMLGRLPGADVLTDGACSAQMDRWSTGLGGVSAWSAVGLEAVHARIHSDEIELAGTAQGHVLLRDRWYGFADGVYAAARLLQVLAERPDAFERLPTEVRWGPVRLEAVGVQPERVAARLAAGTGFSGARRRPEVPGRIEYPDGWGLVWAEEGVLKAVAGGDNPDALARVLGMLRAAMAEVEPDLAQAF